MLNAFTRGKEGNLLTDGVCVLGQVVEEFFGVSPVGLASAVICASLDGI